MASDNPQPSGRQRQRVIYRGRVQGVGFRDTVSRIAAPLPVAGFVRNLADGTVELVAEAAPAVLDQFYREIAASFAGNITSTEVADVPISHPFFQFEIRR
jgi:acylphosphatase